MLNYSNLIEFSQNTTEKIGYYVYCLIDPRDGNIFYIGKGESSRVFNHVSCALNTEDDSIKLNIIREISNAGYNVGHYVIRHGLSEREAFIVESCLIDLLTFKDFQSVSKIANLIAGHESWDKGIKTVEEIELLYSAIPISLNEIKHKVIVININKTYEIGVSPYEATRKYWVINIKRVVNADFVFSEYKGIIRNIYKPKEWFIKDDSKRCFFEGSEVADKMITDLYLNKQIIDKKKGQQNPIFYINM